MYVCIYVRTYMVSCSNESMIL